MLRMQIRGERGRRAVVAAALERGPRAKARCGSPAGEEVGLV